MDIEQQLRGILPLRDPGVAFTDGVMARVADVPLGQADAGVVRLSEARARKRSRRILLGTVVVIAAAAAMPVFFIDGGTDAPVISKAVAVIPDGSATIVPVTPTLASASAEPASAASIPPNCIDPDVLNALLLQGAGQTLRISASPPPELTGFKAPRQLVWMGSSEQGMENNPQSTLSAVYRTSLVPEAARTATAAALAAVGWKPHATYNPMSGNVFIAENMRAGDAYCREGKQVTLAARALENVNYVVLSIPRMGAGFSTACDQPSPSRAAVSTLDAYLPSLEMPLDPATRAPVWVAGMSGGAGSDTKRRMNVRFTLRDSADNVARHFARQIAEQGWDADASWSGRDTAGSSWTRQADADVLQGTLAVSAFADGRFTVVFHVVRTK
jgi:hypothetical protein